MGALYYQPSTSIEQEYESCDFDILQQKALDILKEKSDGDAELLLFNSKNSGGCRPKALFEDEEGYWMVKFRHTYDPQDLEQVLLIKCNVTLLQSGYFFVLEI